MALKGELMMSQMVQAAKENRKFHTARPIKPRHKGNFIDRDLCGNVCEWKQIDCETRQHVERCKPKYSPGDIMYFRETWTCGSNGLFYYKADGQTRDNLGTLLKWHPSIHMPRRVARIFYRVPRITVMCFEDANEQFAREDGFLPSYLNNDPNCKVIHSALYGSDFSGKRLTVRMLIGCGFIGWNR